MGENHFAVDKHLHNPVAGGVRIGNGKIPLIVYANGEITKADHCDAAIHRANADILGRCIRVW